MKENGNRLWSKYVDRQSMYSLIALLSNCPDPSTGKTYTRARLAEEFKCSTALIEKTLSRKGIFHFPTPIVRCEDLPENEKAFFLGLSLGNFAVNSVLRRKKSFIVVGTESDKQFKRDLLKETIGTWGEIHDNPGELKIYLDSPTFSFMGKPNIEAKYFNSITKFAPFLLGVLAAKLSERMNRISLENAPLLKRVHKSFQTHFGYNLGSFVIEQRSPNMQIPVINVKNPGEVLGSLVSVQSTSSLPFLSKLGKLPSID